MNADLQAFLNAKTSAGLSPRTIYWYEMLIGQYLKWAAVYHLDTKKPETVEGHLTYLRNRSKSPFTISDCDRALRCYYKWLVQRKRLKINPMNLVQRPRLPKHKKRHVTPAQFDRLYNSITGNSWIDERDRAIMLVLYYSGLRASELINLRLADIDMVRCLISVKNGKGSQDRDVPIAAEAVDQVRRYVAACPIARNDHLFVAGRGWTNAPRANLTLAGLTQMMRRRCQAIGMERTGIHAFRHGFAMLFLNDGEMELAAVSKSLGHSSTDVTKKFYADYETNTLSRKYKRALANIRSQT